MQRDYEAELARKDAEIAGLMERASYLEVQRDNNEGMAECMRMLRDDCIRLDIFSEKVPPMMYTEAVIELFLRTDLEVAHQMNADFKLIRNQRETIAVLQQELARCRVDAERYRHMRSGVGNVHKLFGARSLWDTNIDAAIAAMGAG